MTLDRGSNLRVVRKYLALGVSIIVVAVAFRVYAIDRLPPGLFGDEAVEGLDALDVLAGNWAIWFHAHLGREPIYVYLVAISYAFFGVTPLATRLPSIVAGITTIPFAFLFTREWARQTVGDTRADRIALLATALLAVSFWHVQMSRDAHRDTLLPLVEVLGYWLFWRGLRENKWWLVGGAGAILGLTIYTYSPGRFVGVFIVIFVALEFVTAIKWQRVRFPRGGLFAGAVCAIVIMLPLGVYFAQNPAQFTRRFESVSVFDAESPPSALVSSVAGNLAQFVVPGSGYQSKHYNLPGKPIFDLLIAPWFLIGLGIAIARFKQPGCRFILIWFLVMLVPAFLTADMIPKGVRALGTVPGVFIFPALAMDALVEWAAHRRSFAVGLVGLCLIGTAVWSAYDYFVSWANLPELPLAFDSDMVEVSDYILRQPPTRPIYISSEVYRPPTEMLLGRHVPTSRYVDPAGWIKEFDAQASLVANSSDNATPYVFVRDRMPPQEWLERIAPNASRMEQGDFIQEWRLGSIALPQRSLDVSNTSFNPLVNLTGVSSYADEPSGIALQWQMMQIPNDRQDMDMTLVLSNQQGQVVSQAKHKFGVPPLDWGIGDIVIEWYDVDLRAATMFHVVLTRGKESWQSPKVPLE